MSVIKPPALRPDDTIGIMAPSSHVDKAEMEHATTFLEQRGYKVFIHPQTYARQNQSAGTAIEKIAALHELLENDAIKAIIMARGGNRCGMMLSDLDYEHIQRHPKIIMGFSDSTALLNAITHKTGIITFHGPMMNWLARDITQEESTQCFGLLAGKQTSMPLSQAHALKSGQTTASLVGGSLSVLTSLIGTPYQPDFNNKILFLEETGDELSRYDRMLIHLRNAGIFAQINGLILGDFSVSDDTGKTSFGYTLEEIIREYTDEYMFPVIMNAPFGHKEHLYTLPIGGEVHLVAEQNHTTLKLTAPAVKI